MLLYTLFVLGIYIGWVVVDSSIINLGTDARALTIEGVDGQIFLRLLGTWYQALFEPVLGEEPLLGLDDREKK